MVEQEEQYTSGESLRRECAHYTSRCTMAGWDVSACRSTRTMFSSATAFSGDDVSGWDVSAWACYKYWVRGLGGV